MAAYLSLIHLATADHNSLKPHPVQKFVLSWQFRGTVRHSAEFFQQGAAADDEALQAIKFSFMLSPARYPKKLSVSLFSIPMQRAYLILYLP